MQQVFDRALVRRRRDRAFATLPGHDFLFREVAARLADRLLDVRRSFAVAAEIGARHGKALPFSFAMELAGRPDVVADEEALPFAPASLDLVFSVLTLHWVNDLPGALLQIREALKPDGLFLAALLGGETLTELRAALLQAEIEVEGGASPRVSPFADVRDLGMLLQRAGFALPVVDADTITVTYPDAFKLMRDLRAMGESNALLARRKVPLRRATLFRAAELYQERHGERIPATFQVLYLTGWSPHASQQRPLRPGEAKTPLAEALKQVP